MLVFNNSFVLKSTLRPDLNGALFVCKGKARDKKAGMEGGNCRHNKKLKQIF